MVLLFCFFGGLGLWVGATQQGFLIGCLGFSGALVSILFRKSIIKDENSLKLVPGLWRTWGRVGAGVSLLFYVIEYFPNHMGMRLEVNHPLYALAWLSGGEFLYHFTLCLYRRPLQHRARHIFYLFLSLVGVALLPVAIIFGPDSWHFVHNDSMRLTHHLIQEFASLDVVKIIKSSEWLILFGLLPFSVFFLVVGMVLRLNV